MKENWKRFTNKRDLYFIQPRTLSVKRASFVFNVRTKLLKMKVIIREDDFFLRRKKKKNLLQVYCILTAHFLPK